MDGFVIDRVSEDPKMVLRLSGRIEAEHIQQLISEISRGTPVTALDPDEVKRISRDSIRFLEDSEAQGTEPRRSHDDACFTLKDSGEPQVLAAKPPFRTPTVLETRPITHHVMLITNENGRFASPVLPQRHEVQDPAATVLHFFRNSISSPDRNRFTRHAGNTYELAIRQASRTTEILTGPDTGRRRQPDYG
jgi:hypothetical protein